MKPQTLQASRQIATTILTVVGIGLFIVVGIHAVNQVADRRYTEGKQRAIPSTASPTVTANNVVANAARYPATLARMSDDTSVDTQASAASPSTPPASVAVVRPAAATATSSGASSSPSSDSGPFSRSPPRRSASS